MISITRVLAAARKCKTGRQVGRLEIQLGKMAHESKKIDHFTHVYALGYLNAQERARYDHSS